MRLTGSLNQKSLGNLHQLLEKVHSKDTLTMINGEYRASTINKLQSGDIYISTNTFPALSKKLTPKEKSIVGKTSFKLPNGEATIDNKTGKVLEYKNLKNEKWQTAKKKISDCINNFLENFESDKIKKSIVSIRGMK